LQSRPSSPKLEQFFITMTVGALEEAHEILDSVNRFLVLRAGPAGRGDAASPVTG